MTERCKHLLLVLIEKPERHVPVTDYNVKSGGQPRCYPGQPNLALPVALRTTLI